MDSLANFDNIALPDSLAEPYVPEPWQSAAALLVHNRVARIDGRACAYMVSEKVPYPQSVDVRPCCPSFASEVGATALACRGSLVASPLAELRLFHRRRCPSSASAAVVAYIVAVDTTFEECLQVGTSDPLHHWEIAMSVKSKVSDMRQEVGVRL